MYAQICDCNINLNLVAKDISQFSNAAAVYAPRRADATAAATEKRSIMHKAKYIQIMFKKSWKTLWNMYISTMKYVSTGQRK